MIRTFETQCKFCKKTIYPKFDTDCDQDWLDQLAPMICCNQCADVRTSLRGQRQHFTTLCVFLQTGRGDRSTAEDKLRHLAWKLGSNYGMIETNNEVCLSSFAMQDAIDQLVSRVMQKPDSGLEYLDEFRHIVTELAKGKQCNQQPTTPAEPTTSDTPLPRSYVD